MNDDLEDVAIDEAEAIVGWEAGMRDENQGLRMGIHRAIEALEKGDTAGAAAKLRELVGRKERQS